jgi:NAD-dependent dihydropyrimidine dehydrogenase PreA subunit/flavodoxin
VGAPRCLICYWSLTGATQRVAERIAEGIRSEGGEPTLADVRDGVPPDVSASDVVGIGFPVHWYRAPAPVSRAINAMGRLEGKPVFVFSTNGTFRSSAVNGVRRALARRRGTEVGVFTSLGEGHFYPYARRGHQFSPGHPTATELEAARAFGAGVVRVVRALSEGEPAPPPAPRDPHGHPLYAFIRLVSSQAMVRLVYARFFHADRERCVKCGLCARACPVGNIAWEKGRVPAWGRDCVNCLECVRVCPEGAVVCPIDWPIFAPFISWTIGQALRQPGLEHACVEFRRGKITRKR